jgi:hypothetical protein
MGLPPQIESGTRARENRSAPTMTEQLPTIIDQTESITRFHATHVVPVLITTAGERASLRFLEFFAAN